MVSRFPLLCQRRKVIDLQKSTAEASYLLTFDPAKEQNYEGKIHVPILIPMWRAPVSASILINKQERFSLMHRLTGTELCLETGLEKTKVEAAAEADKKD